METEAKAKVVASVWGTKFVELIFFLKMSALNAAFLQVPTLKVVDLKFPTRHKYETF